MVEIVCLIITFVMSLYFFYDYYVLNTEINTLYESIKKYSELEIPIRKIDELFQSELYLKCMISGILLILILVKIICKIQLYRKRKADYLYIISD